MVALIIVFLQINISYLDLKTTSTWGREGQSIESAIVMSSQRFMLCDKVVSVKQLMIAGPFKGRGKPFGCLNARVGTCSSEEQFVMREAWMPSEFLEASHTGFTNRFPI